MTSREKLNMRNRQKERKGRGWDRGLNERDRYTAIKDTGKKLAKKRNIFTEMSRAVPASLNDVLDVTFKSCPMWSSNRASHTALQTYDYKNIPSFWDVTPCSLAGMPNISEDLP
jgi:hypothetical protein